MYTDGGNLTVITRITVDSNTTTHLFSIIAATCFGPKGHNQVGKNGRLNTQFSLKTEILIPYVSIYCI